MKRIILTVFSAAFGGMLALGVYSYFEKPQQVTLVQQPEPAVRLASFPERSNLVSSSGNPDFTGAAALATPGVVHIKTTYTREQESGAYGFFDDEVFERFFRMPMPKSKKAPTQKQMASGSGVLIAMDGRSSEGYIVTNNHVIEGADEIEVILNDKRSFTAKVIGTDPTTDVGLIKIEAKEQALPFLAYGNSDHVRVGEWVLAVGNPFNLNSTVTAGIISAKARNIGILAPSNLDRESGVSSAIEAFIQTDAAINKGNSGGALVNTKGELIGINTAIASRSGSSEGYGFAIPINLVQKVVADLLKHGKVQRAMLGIQFQENNAQLAKDKGLKSIQGIYVAEVIPEGAADKAGIQKGDLITHIGGQEIKASATFQEGIARLRPNDVIELTYERKGLRKTTKATLKSAETTNIMFSSKTMDALGVEFEPLSKRERKDYKLEGGVKIKAVASDGLFAKYGLKKGDIVLKVNNKPVSSESEVHAALQSIQKGMLRIECLSPGENTRFVYTFPVK